MMSAAATAWRQAIRLGPELFWVGLGHGLMLLGGFVGIKILTTLLPPDGYGLFSLGLAIAAFLHMLVYAPLAQHTLRFLPAASETGTLGRFKAASDRAYRRATILVIAAAAPVLIGLGVLGQSGWIPITALALSYGIIFGWRARFEHQQMAARERRMVALFQVADAWLRPALAGLAVLLIAPAAAPALLGYGLTALILTLLQARAAAPIMNASGACPPDAAAMADERLALWRYCLPAALMAAAGATSLFADRWMLQGLLGARELGLYFAIYQIANAPAVLFVGIVSQFFLPIIFGRAGALARPAQAAASARVLAYTIASFLVLMAPFVAIAYFFSAPIVRLVAGDAYLAHHALLWVMVCALGLNQLGMILTYKGAYRNRLGLYVLPRLGQAALLVALMSVLVPSRGVAGAAYAVLAAAATYVAWLAVINRRMERIARRPELP